MDLSVIIVSYNTKDLLKKTIESVVKTAKNVEYEIIVVDNASGDGSPDMVLECFPEVVLIKSDKNEGFACANNKGIKIAKGSYVLLLNSDTVVVEDCIRKCIDYMYMHDDIGALGCKVVLPDGRLDHACKRGFPTPGASLAYMLKLDRLFKDNRKFGQYDMTYVGEDEISEVDAVMGAFMMVRREAVLEVGGLDEEFFMYGEDIDWCFRIKEKGYKVVYYPEGKIIHYKGSSSKKRRFMTVYEFHRAMYIFYNKHYRNKYNFLVNILVYIGITLKMILSLFINIFRGR